MNVHQPADVFVHTPTNELFVADGYGNHRVVVFDAETGKFKRTWGAFGTPPPTMTRRPRARSRRSARHRWPVAVRARARHEGLERRHGLRGRSHQQPRIQMFTPKGKFLGR